MLSVCLMTQDYQMFFLRTNSFSILISPSIAQSLFFFLPHFYRFHFVIIISLHPSLSLCRSLLFVHLFIWSAVSHVNRTMQTKYEKESFLCYKAEIEKNHTHKHSHTHWKFEHGPNRQVYLKMMNADWTYTSASVLVPEMISERRCSSLFGRLLPSFHVFMCVWC